jgi:nicotinate-nucleotide adenylyltransferase
MIGVLGGSFDPIHLGHLRPALDVLQTLDLQEIRFIPLNVAVHRTQPAASARQRLAMVRAAVAGQRGFVADERELQREGSSYSYDTLVSLRRDFGPHLPICLLIGADAFRDFANWHRPEDVLSLAHLVVMQRPCTGDATDDSLLRRWVARRRADQPDALRSAPGGRILFQDVTQLDISATAIRRLLAAGLSPRFLLPDAVLEIIEREAPYG